MFLALGEDLILNYGTIGIRDSSFYSPSLNPWFITGLLDGEGSFVITIWKKSKIQNRMNCPSYIANKNAWKR